MTDTEFKLVLDLFIGTDPSTMTEDLNANLESFLDRESQSRGWRDLTGAFHDEKKIWEPETLDEIVMSTRHQAEIIAAAKTPEPLSSEDIARLAEEERGRMEEWRALEEKADPPVDRRWIEFHGGGSTCPDGDSHDLHRGREYPSKCTRCGTWVRYYRT